MLALWKAKENRIDHMVYALYGLTDEEIAIVEGGVPCGGVNEA